MVYRNILKYIFVCVFSLCFIAPITAAEKPPAYTVYNGQVYRWNKQMKKYHPYQTPEQRLQEKYLKRQLQNMNSRATMSQPTRIKWWDL